MDTSRQDGRLDTKVWAKPIMNKEKEIVSIVSSLLYYKYILGLFCVQGQGMLAIC